jgi:Ecdysteroid kinase-like family
MSGRAQRPAPIPQTAEEITAPWCTHALSGSSDRGVVEAVTVEAIGTDIGFAGDVLRVHLSWAEPGDGRPPSIVVKVPATNRMNRASAEAIGAYQREILVYRELSEHMGLPMPRHLHSEMTPDPAPWLEPVLIWLFDHLPMAALALLTKAALWLSGHSKRRYVLVIEDIPDARPPRQREGGTTEDVRDALVVLARFHAAHWMDQALVDEHPWIMPLDAAPRLMQAAYRNNRQEFLDRMGPAVHEDTMRRIDAVQDNLPAVLHRLTTTPWTLLHGDFRLDNVLVRADGSLVVLDFQLPRYGRAANDLAYFITTAIDACDHAAEQELLRLYHSTLESEGVSGYSYDQLVADVRDVTLVLGHSMVTTAQFLDLSLTDGDSSFGDELSLRTLGWLDAQSEGGHGLPRIA